MANFIEFKIYRNTGLWWEPGAFAIFLNLTFIFLLINNNLSKSKFLLLSVVIFSTASTAGLIAYLILTFLYLNIIFKKSREGLWLFIFPLAICGGYYFFIDIMMW